MKEIVKAESDLFWAIPLAMFYFDLLWKEPPLKKIEKKMQVIIKILSKDNFRVWGHADIHVLAKSMCILMCMLFNTSTTVLLLF